MSRRRASVKKRLIPDAKYNSFLVSKFINILMYDGKKSIAERVFYGVMEKMSITIKEDPLQVFKRIVDHVRPSVEVCSRRLGGSTYQIPREVSDHRSVSLAIKWIVRSANMRKRHSITRKLYEEMIDAYNERGAAIKIRDEMHKVAEANKAFAHFRW